MGSEHGTGAGSLELVAEVRRLREENARLNKENDDWHQASRALREEIERLQKALDDEKSLTAATAEHTSKIEARLKQLEREDPTISR